MKLVLILCGSDRVDELFQVIDRHEVHAFTEIPELRGSGETGRHMGTRAFPGTVSLVFTAVPRAKAGELIEALREFDAACAPGEGLRVFSLDVEQPV